MNPTAVPIKDLAFAARLRELMDRDSLSQAAAASLCGVTVTALQNYLKGRMPQPAQAKAISKAFEVSLSWLLEGGEAALDRVPKIVKPVVVPGFSNAVLDALEATGRTTDSMARALGVQPSDVQGWIGNQAFPDLETLGRLFVMTAAAALSQSARLPRQAGGAA